MEHKEKISEKENIEILRYVYYIRTACYKKKYSETGALGKSKSWRAEMKISIEGKVEEVSQKIEKITKGWKIKEDKKEKKRKKCND